MRFVKLHGCGNDYIFLNCLESAPDDLPGLARRLSDRHFGVGADGLICAFPSRTADFKMVMFNADGSEGAMCGNGIRCLGKFLYDNGWTDQTGLSIETRAGERRMNLWTEGGKVAAATVDMGEPVVEPPIQITIKGIHYTSIPVSMGNPHSVVPVDDPEALDLPVVGPAFENWPYFPDRVNTEFVRVDDAEHLSVRVWERGSGETLACGTGACAAAAALRQAGRCGRDVTVRLPGGELRVTLTGDGRALLTGPAAEAFRGEVDGQAGIRPAPRKNHAILPVDGKSALL